MEKRGNCPGFLSITTGLYFPIVLIIVVIGLYARFPDLAWGIELSKAGEAGVSAELAVMRSKSLDSLGYNVYYRIVEGRDIRGSVNISFVFKGLHSESASLPLILDFAGKEISGVELNGSQCSYALRDEHIFINSEHLAEGRNELLINFIPDERPFHREKDFLYTLFVPDKARMALPCFDQPDLKANFKLTLDIPSDWVAVSNSKVVVDSIRGGLRRVEFARTSPLSTYLFSFVAGRFLRATHTSGKYPMAMYYLASDSARVRRNSEEIFRLHETALEWLENYTGIKYPFDKFEFVLIPSFPYSGMEHPGAILYRSSRLLLTGSPTEMELLRRAGVISHETAHMWFGDLVSIKWFNDVWLKEAFAQFMADRIVEPLFGSIDHRLLFFTSHADRLYEVERTPATHPIRQTLDNLSHAGSLYGNIIYHKPPLVLNQLEKIMGKDSLRVALQDYLESFSYSSADWHDLVKILDRHSKEDIASWSEVWVERAHRPEITTEVKYDAVGRISSFKVKERYPSEENLFWPQKINVSFFGPGGIEDTTIEVYLNSPVVEVGIARGRKVDYYLLDSTGEGFGFFRLDPSLAENPAKVSFNRAIERAVYSFQVWDYLLETGNINPEAFATYLYRLFGKESNGLIVQANLNRFRRFFWDFLPSHLKLNWGGRFEKLFITKMESELPPSIRRAYFKAFCACVLTSDGVRSLREFWSGEKELEGVEFSERDFCDMALELAVREVDGWQDILERQLSRIKNDKLKSEFSFVMRAASPVPEIREDFFDSLKDPYNRRHEPWVLSALYYLHHPLRNYDSLRFIEESLDMLQEIERTGDIFFPKSWVETTMMYHSSEGAYEVVKRFISEHQDYPQRLMRIVRRAMYYLSRSYFYKIRYTGEESSN